jgi:sugar/nucleoside kinase (ribokinase family)
MAKPYDLLVAGEINPDLILSGPNLAVGFGQQETLVERATLTIGSSSAIFACGAARLGLKVAFIGVVGEDLFGGYMLEALRERGVDTSPVLRDPSQPTGLSVILSRGADRAILTHPGSMAALNAGQVTDALLGQSRHLHIASYFLQTGLQPGLPGLFERAHRLGLTTSLDTNWDPAEGWEGVTELLPWIDVFLPNEAEAIAISDEMDLQTAGEKLASYGPLVVIKRGAEGAAAFQGGRRWAARAETVDASSGLVDQVGAGDNFDAGFLRGWLLGLSVDECLNLGCRCARSSLFAAGGIAAQLTEDIQPDMKRKGQRLE